MATVADAFPYQDRRPDLLSGTPRAHSIDRWIFVFQVVPTIYHGVWHFAQTAPPDVRAKMQGRLLDLDNILLMQIPHRHPVPAADGNRACRTEGQCRDP